MCVCVARVRFFRENVFFSNVDTKKGDMTERLLGASVLPVMLDLCYGTLYFLLAKERYHPSWPDGSCLWTDFGGRKQQSEAAEDVACREFFEETLGQVRFSEDDTLFHTTWDAMVGLLEQKQYLFQFTHVQNESRFVTFVVQIPWDPSAPQRFTAALQQCLHDKTKEECYLEKSHIRLFSVPQVLRAVQHRGYLTASERCSPTLTQALSIILPELQFHFPHLF